MRISHDPDDSNPRFTFNKGISVGSVVAHARDETYRAYFVIASTDGTKITIDPDEARRIVEGLSERLVSLAEVDGDAERWGQTLGRKK